jgi:hypothetical protein
MADNYIADDADLRKYRTELPNLIDDMDLSTYAYRLYGHIKRVAGGNGGACFESTRTMAERCHISIGSVSRAKQELVEAGLIEIEVRDREHGQTDYITIRDIWPLNFATYAGQKQASTCSPEKHPVHTTNRGVPHMDQGCSPHEQGVPHMDQKKEPVLRNNQNEEGTEDPSPAGEGAAAAKEAKPKPKPKPGTHPNTKPILDAYQAVMEEFEPGAIANYAQEGAGAKRLAQAGHEPETVADCFRWLKEDQFWAGKHVSLQVVGKQIGAYLGTRERKEVILPNGRDRPRQTAGSDAVDRVFARLQEQGVFHE